MTVTSPASLAKIQKIIASALVVLSIGCSAVGPEAIRSGRLAYNEAISETNKQQILKLIVQERYGEQGSLLAVASVTANVSVSTNVGLQRGFGDGDDYAGNLVPFRGAFVYEENPTISYTPVDGAAYLRQVMSPIPIEILAKITMSMSDPKSSWYSLVSSVNGLHNPLFVGGAGKEDPRFERFVDIMTLLGESHRLHWAEEAGHPGKFSIIIDHSDEEYTNLVQELQLLCGLSDGEESLERTIVPVALTWSNGNDGSLGIITRSIWQLVEMLVAVVDVPGKDTQAGIVRPPQKVSKFGSALRIGYSKSRIDHAYVDVPYREGWFYIDDRDLETKQYFKLLGGLLSTAMADTTASSTSSPILTVPLRR